MVQDKRVQASAVATPRPDRNQIERIRFAISTLLERWRVPEDVIVSSTAVLVGAGTGLGAVLFIWLLGQIGQLARWTRGQVGDVVGILGFMAVAGAIVGFMIDRWAREAKGHGVPEVMEAIAMRGGRIRARVAAVKVLASSLTIGAGGSAGREGPIVQVGAALGSTVGQLLRFSDDRVRTLVACGSAAGIAATFNAPIAGTIFAMEVILGSFTVHYFGAVVISAVSAGIISRHFLGDRPAFLVPAYPMNHVLELPIYVLLGILAALVAVAFIRLLYRTEAFFDRWQAPLPVKTSVGLVLTGLTALLLPGRQVLGSGLDMIGETIAENFNLSLGLLAALLVLKLLATCWTLGSGNSGGVFAPSLFMGAILGGMVGNTANSLWPQVAANPGAYAIVGMAAVFAAAARAPITAVLIVFEMSGDYKLIFPLMMTTVLATLLAEHLFSESIYTLKLKLRGISLQRGRDVDILQNVTVGEVMSQEVNTVPKDMTLTELSDMFSRTRNHGYPVLDENGKLWGIVTITDLEQAIADNRPRRTTVAEIGVPRAQLLVATPDESIGEALARMGTRGLGRLPVVDPRDPDRLVGLIRRSDIIRAYNLALARRAELQHRAKRMQLRNIDGTEFVDITLDADSPVVGKTVQEVAASLPRECILVSIRRQGKMLIPHGHNVFQPGDRITAFTRSSDAEALRQCLQKKAPSAQPVP